MVDKEKAKAALGCQIAGFPCEDCSTLGGPECCFPDIAQEKADLHFFRKHFAIKREVNVDTT